MEIQYQRTLKDSYMVIRVEEEIPDCDMQILKHCHCDGLLPVELFMQNGKEEFWFEVSGKQSLDIYAATHPLEKEFFYKFLSSLGQTVEWMEAHLLEEGHILLSGETIFLNPDTGRCSFCYCPAYEGTLSQQFRNFMEEMLKKIDHGQRETVRLVYELYDVTLREGYQFSELTEVLEKFAQHEAELPEAENVQVQTEKKLACEHEILPENVINGEKFKRVEWDGIKGWCEGFLKRFEGGIQKRKREEIPLCFEPEEETGGSHPTVLLARRDSGVQGILQYEGSGEQDDFRITEVPFLIGSEEGSVQGLIANEAVSRTHARITREGDVYFLEDLNSTNGTFFDGELLNYKVKVSLQPNCRIRFANESYRFL